MKNQEFGRSMVEMLGVLAIIGVLSIGGIAGYSMSMRKHRANQIADALNKYALIIYDSCQKAIINGEIKSLDSCNSMSPIPYPLYNESDLASQTHLGSIVIEGVGSSIESSSTNPGNSVVDSVRLRLDFPDKAICKAVATVMGTTNSSFTGWDGTIGSGSLGASYPGNRCEDSIPWITTQFVFK